MAELLTGDTASFTSGLGTWNKSGGNANFTLAHSSADGGVAEIDVTTGGSNIAVCSHVAGDGASKPAVTPGETITVGAPLKQVDGPPVNWRVEVNWYAADGVTVAEGGSNIQVAAGTTTVGGTSTLSGTIVVPAGAGKVRQRIWIGAPAAGSTFRLLSASIDDGTGGGGGETPTGNVRRRVLTATGWVLVDRGTRITRIATSAPPPSTPLPTGLTATGGDGQVALSWTEPNPSTDVTDYRVQYATSSSGPWTTFDDGVSTATVATVPGLTNGTPYWFRVAAVRLGVGGTYTAPVSATPADLPGPTALQADPDDGRVALSWTAPSPATGVTDYSVQRRLSPSGAWTTVAHGSTVTSRTVTGLTNGTPYDFRVAAVRDGVVGAYTAGPVTATPVAPTTPPPGGLAIYGEHVGFGNPGLTNPTTITVTSSADSGAGTLRSAVAGNAHKHIVFAADMTINLTDEIRPGANTLIDGRGRNVVVRGTSSNGAFIISNVWNVTLTDFAIRDCGNLANTGSNDPYDGILIEGSTDVWIHHMDLSRCSDKVVVSQGSVGVVVSWCHIHDQEQTMQIGDQTGGELRDGKQRVTVHHNYFDGVDYRTPVVSYGWAHVFNNYIRDWDPWAIRSQRIARAHVERNVWLGVRSPRATTIDTPGNGCNDSGTRCDDRDGFLTLDGNIALPGSVALTFLANGTTFNPRDFYSYTAETAGQTLANSIVAGVGPR